MLETREEMRRTLLPVVGEYAATLLSEGVAGDGRCYTLIVVESAQLFRADGTRGVTPAQGDLVEVYGTGSWALLLVDRAAFGEGKIAMVGLTRGTTAAAAGVDRPDGGEFKCYDPPALMQFVTVTDALALAATEPVDPWAAWIGRPNAVVGERAGSMVSVAQFEQQFGAMPGYGSALAWTPPAKGRRLRRLRMWLALRCAPWLSRAAEAPRAAQRCRGCGCTNSEACVLTTPDELVVCSWVEDDLCSACAPGAASGWVRRTKSAGWIERENDAGLLAESPSAMGAGRVHAANVARESGGWPRVTEAPGPADTVQVVMTEELARRFEGWLHENTIGRCRLAPAMLFAPDDLPTYVISPTELGEGRMS